MRPPRIRRRIRATESIAGMAHRMRVGQVFKLGVWDRRRTSVAMIRRWVSDVSGPVNITLSFQHDNNITGFAYDGVHGYVYVDGQEVWHQYAAR